MTKTEMLGNLINYYSNGNKAQFANKLGVKPQTINTWENRNSFDIELIYSKCEDISGDWLLSGEGDMLKTSRNANYEEIDKLKAEIERLRKVNHFTHNEKALEVSLKFFEATKEMFNYYSQMK